MENTKENNKQILRIFSKYLNNYPCSITTGQIQKVMKYCDDEEKAYLLLLEEYLNLDSDSLLAKDYLPNIIKKLDEAKYKDNPYYKNITLKPKKVNNWNIVIDKYQPYEAFVYQDFVYMSDGRVFPQIGYFNKPFYYLAVYENNRLWMSITPNEIETIDSVVKDASGIVLTLGLGLGYFAYMASLKKEVKKVIIIEKSKDVINLFQKEILPQFEFLDKIEIINCDAFDFLENKLKNYSVDFLFADIWHDVADGKELYLRIKKYEEIFPSIKFTYWIEETIKYYL